MKRIAKFSMLGGALAMMASAAVAQPRDRDRDRDRDDIDTEDVITGVAILGGIAAIAAAIDRDRRSYGYRGRFRYRNAYRNAVNACAFEAERFGRGGVRITYVDRRGANRYRVKGIIRRGFGMRYDRWGSEYRRWGMDRSRNRYFACTARGNGRILDFDLSGRDIW
jgi:hypothetical protein